MAHKGKFYEVWFRRDFAVNRLNFQGFCRRYFIDAGTWNSPAVGGNFILHFVATNDNRDAGDTRLWTFNTVVLGGARWSGDMTVVNDPIQGWQDTRIRLFTDVIPIAWAGTFKNAELNPGYSDYVNSLDPTFILETAFCQRVPGEMFLDAHPVFWGDPVPP